MLHTPKNIGSVSSAALLKFYMMVRGTYLNFTLFYKMFADSFANSETVKC